SERVPARSIRRARPRVTARAQQRSRRLVSLAVLPCCLLLLAAAAPDARAARFQKAFWGPTAIDGKSQFPVYKRLGVTLYQMILPWASAAPTRPANPKDPRDPAYHWPAEIDAAIAQARRHGMRVLLMPFGAPPWANGGRTPEWAPDRPSDYAAFARAAARRYPSVRHWMIWGEPSRSNNWKPFVEQPMGDGITAGSRRVARRYARLLDAAYGQLKAQRRSNVVIGGNTYTTGEIRPRDWVRSMRLPNRRPPRMDLYGHNPFSIRRPDLRNPPSLHGVVDFSDLARFDRLVQRDLARPRRKRIRLFLSEFTIPTGPDVEFNFYVSPRTQSRWITNAFRIARRLKAHGLGWIHLRDDPPIRGGTAISGGLLTHDGRRKPGFYAFMRGGLTAAQRARARNQ
ncbi:MAG: hypothetical protein M3N47_03885, partial [Chloroflexota bacterium]|nr:hypothetical protein [Chloroflexota bacterium]